MCQVGKQNKGDDVNTKDSNSWTTAMDRGRLREVQIQKVKREDYLSCRRAGFIAFFVWVMGQQN